MASLRGRYFSARDINFINSINAELMGDIIETLVTVFKIAASETKVNLYGESAPSEGKTFYPGWVDKIPRVTVLFAILTIAD